MPLRKAVLAVAVVFSAAACGDVGTNPNQGMIKVNNQSTWRISDVFISACNSGSWGTDELASSIAPRLQMGFDVDPGCWDVRVVDEYGVNDDYRGIQIEVGEEYILTYTG
jgi:hypothetical protein